jgi:ATP-dependent Clp protease adaptor protein ClpS
MEDMAETDKQAGGEVLERTKQETKKPELFKVLLLNDDYTTMDFVVEVLESVFHKQPAEAFRIMMAVHTQGKGLCGVYPFEVAETKVETVVERAREHGFPLRAAMEPE